MPELTRPAFSDFCDAANRHAIRYEDAFDLYERIITAWLEDPEYVCRKTWAEMFHTYGQGMGYQGRGY